MKRALLVLFILVAVFAPAAAFADEDAGGYIQLPPCTDCGRCGFEDFLQLFINLYHFGLELVGPLAILFFIIGGVIMLTASGYETRYKLGRDIISQVVAGLIVALMSWVIVDTTIFFLTGDADRTVFGKPWYQGFTYETSDTGGEVCAERPTGTGSGSGSTSTPEPPPGETCTDHEALAAAQPAPQPHYPAENAPILNGLIDCVLDHGGRGLIDERQDVNLFTYGIDFPTLNFTRGAQTADGGCQTCSVALGECHNRFSCHYGGRTGTEGAMAVDFNSLSGTEEGERAVCAAVEAAVDGPCTTLAQAGSVLCHGNHTHVSAAGCTSSGD